MTPYILAYLSMPIAAFVFKIISPTRYKLNYLIYFGFLWCALLALRHPSMGIDLHYGGDGYLSSFQKIDGLSWQDVFFEKVKNYEPGYVIFNKLLSVFGDNYQILVAACSILIMTLVGLWLYRSTEYPFLASVIYLGLPTFVINFSALRQAIAVSITLYAYEKLKNKKAAGFTFIVLIASSFHASALLFLAAYPIFWHFKSKFWQWVSALLPLVFYRFADVLFPVLSKLLKPDAIIDNNAAWRFLAFLYVIYIYTLAFSRKKDEVKNGERNLFFIAVLIQCLAGLNSIVNRAGWYFIIYLAPLLPKVLANGLEWAKIKQEHRAQSRLVYVCLYQAVFIFFVLFGLYQLQNTYWAMASPYKFFWE